MNSRAYFAKSVIGLLFAAFAATASADVNVYTVDNRAYVCVDHEIDPGDLAKLEQAWDKSRDWVCLMSPGGDIEESLRIGQFLRAHQATAVVPEQASCSSACVFLLAGATERIVWGKVGIHRPYITSTAERSFEEREQSLRARNTALRKYLSEMHIPETLLDAMNSVPPQEVRVLSAAELSIFGLSEKDPVQQESDDAKEARSHGITMQEFLQRKAEAKLACRFPGVPDQTTPASTEALRIYTRCKDDVMNGVGSQPAAQSH